MSSIRPDFHPVKLLMERLLMYAQQFHNFNTEDWSHLKNQEDYRNIFRFAPEDYAIFESIYGDGRDCAVSMSNYLSCFNDIGNFPTLQSYVHSFDGGWVYDIESLQSTLKQAQKKAKELVNIPWAVRQMMQLFEKQINLLLSVQQTLKLLQQTPLYKMETTGSPLQPETPSSITIGNFQGIMGNVSHSSVVQNLDMNIQQGDFESLARYLSSINVSEPDIHDLQIAIQTDGKLAEKGKLGKSVAGWLGNMVGKCASGLWKFSINTASSVLAQAIAAHYGWV
jgi:hypothetical protein